MSPDPFTVTIQEAMRLTGLCRGTFYNLMNKGKVRHVKVGRRTLLEYASLRRLLIFGGDVGRGAGTLGARKNKPINQ